MRLAYDIVDVFTERPFAGNQLAVVHGAGDLSTEQCQAIAKEFNYSETTFPVPRSDDEYAVRIFTPGNEIPFAGHPTLGTAWVLRSRGELTGESVTQQCGAGPVGVRFFGDRVVELSAVPRDSAASVPGPIRSGAISVSGIPRSRWRSISFTARPSSPRNSALFRHACCASSSGMFWRAFASRHSLMARACDWRWTPWSDCSIDRHPSSSIPSIELAVTR